MSAPDENVLRHLPSVDALLRSDDVAELIAVYGRDTVIGWIRNALDRLRAECTDESSQFDRNQWTQLAIERIRQLRDDEELLTLEPVINATGVVLHTNLGRAPLADRAIAAMQNAARNTNVEIDLATGDRRYRGHQLDHLWRELTGAEASLVVNNCAAATLLALQALAVGREVVVSRGQLIEIGGSYRLPDVFKMSGAILREVGTTNRTRLADYDNAIGDNTAALLRVHPSNFRVLGFTESVDIAELVNLAKRRSLLAIDDVGSGCLTDLQPFGLPKEPLVQDSIRAGVDVVVFSGDKLLGGPQCGVLLGKSAVIERVRKSPVARALRIDKLTLAALQATLEIHRHGNALEEIPTLAMLTAEFDVLRRRAEQLADLIRPKLGAAKLEVVESKSAVGGGSLPLAELPTFCLQLAVPGLSADQLAKRLRINRPHVVPRIESAAVCFDLRTICLAEHQSLATAIGNVI